MKILVLAGSPKGEQSITMQYVEYIRLKFPEHEFQVRQISQRLAKIENDRATFDEIIATAAAADGILWAVPVYVYLVPAQYKRFIELIAERRATAAFRGKYAAALTTSIHFFDHTAHEYLRAVSEDLEMKYVGGHSAEMYDLAHRREREVLGQFAADFLEAIEQKRLLPRQYYPAAPVTRTYASGPAPATLETRGNKVLLLHDARPEDGNLRQMIARAEALFHGAIETVSLHDADIRGGCLGCLRCAYDNRCVYDGKDGYRALVEERIAKADVLIFGATIVDRYFSARWKLFFDRLFYQNHKPWMPEKQFVFLVSGPLSQNANLRQIMQSMAELNRSNLVGIATDEAGSGEELDGLLDSLAAQAVAAAVAKRQAPPTYLSVGGRKIFRDGVFGGMGGIFQADDRFYRATGAYDFPHKLVKERLINALLKVLFIIPALRRRFYQREIIPGMIAPLRKVLKREANSRAS